MQDPLTQDDCNVAHVIELFAGRWKLLIIYWLLQGPHRFNALQRQLGPITHRTLARQLADLTDTGFVIRTDLKTVPPHVEYSLTPLGHSLVPVLQTLHDWTKNHAAELSFTPNHPAIAPAVPAD